MDSVIGTDEYTRIRLAIVLPFICETRGNFQKALKDHEQAVIIIQAFLDSFKKKIGKFYRVMFERQRDVHLERLKYLKELEKKGSWEGVVVPPTILSADEGIKLGGNNGRPLSLDHKELFQSPKSNGRIDQSTALEGIKHLLVDPIPFFTPTLNASLPPIVYRIVHQSELIMLGQRSHWLYVKDETNAHTLYAMHALWEDNYPIRVALLRRAGEFLPGAGAVRTTITRTAGGSFVLNMDTTSSIGVTETPDRQLKSKNWSPRRFDYGGRKFVWKAAKDGGAFSKFEWETLYETKKIWPKEGSKTGKMEDEIVGDRLCWGEKGGGKKVDHTIFMAAGLDQHFREHLLASQLARFMRTSYPPNKDNEAAEAAGAAASLFGLMTAFS